MAFLVSVGTDGVTDWVKTPDGQRFNLGPVSVLRFVTKLSRGQNHTRRTLDRFLKEGEVLLSVDEGAMWELVKPQRARWAKNTEGSHGFPYGSVLETVTAPDQPRLAMNIFENLDRTEKVVSYLDKLASAGKTDPKAFEYLKKEAGKIQSPNQSNNSTYYGLGEPDVHEVTDAAPKPHTVAAAAENLTYDVYETNMKLARQILDLSQETVATIDRKVAAGKKFNASRAKGDVHALTSKVASICETTTLTEDWVVADLQKLASRSKSLLRLFTGSKYGDLHDYKSGKYLRPATKEEQRDSQRAGDSGVIKVDGRSVYVED